MGTFNTAFNTFLPHAYTFVTGSTSSFSVDQLTEKVITTYQLQTQTMEGAPSTPLQALSATQYNNLTSDETPLLMTDASNNYLSYVSPHGEMLLWNGPVFRTELQYTGILPQVPSLPGSDTTDDGTLWHNYLLPILQGVSTQAQADGLLVLDQLFPVQNNYIQAQSMYGASQLVPILLEISQNTTDLGLSANDRVQAAAFAEQIYNQVKNLMSAWLSVSDDQRLQQIYYQPAQIVVDGALAQGWQSLLTILSGFGSSEKLNDHQLIAGYFIKVAAFLAQYDTEWGETSIQVKNGMTVDTLVGQMGDIINMMIDDAANDNRSSTVFPFMRNFDVYAGHSWADGAANDNQGTNLESSSEALNFDAALIQWGQVTGNRTTTDIGVYMYTTELQSVNTYWFSDLNTTDPKGNATNVIPQQYLFVNGVQRRFLVTEVTGNGGTLRRLHRHRDHKRDGYSVAAVERLRLLSRAKSECRRHLRSGSFRKQHAAAVRAAGARLLGRFQSPRRSICRCSTPIWP